MKRLTLVVICILICSQSIGCAKWTVRTSTARKARVDQEISGNRGFISGRARSVPQKPSFTERKVYKIEVEMPELAKRKKAKAVKKKPDMATQKDQNLWGNRGYVFGGAARKAPAQVSPPQVKRMPPSPIKEQTASALKPKPSPAPIRPKAVEAPKPKKSTKMYVYKVRKGDTLQKISRRFYGTTRKWALLYKTNQNKLKSPDSIYPGQVLSIPQIDEFKK